jgi:hypothetical protein
MNANFHRCARVDSQGDLPAGRSIEGKNVSISGLSY